MSEQEQRLDDSYNDDSREDPTHEFASETDESKDEITISSSSDETESNETDPQDLDEFTLITWNIDGLDERNRELRTRAACRLVGQINTDMFFFQEVVPETISLIRHMMPEYDILSTNENSSYFTTIGLRKATVKMLHHRIINFEDTQMDRCLNEAMVKISGINIRLMNTHLESCAEGSSARKRQFSQCLRRMNDAPDKEVVIFGGDLNLRDKEAFGVGIYNRITDLWRATGSRKECQYTWDMTRNDNHKFTGEGDRRFCRFRFDRLYLRDSIPSSVVPEYFGLIGLERLKPNVCFPSDHWGILSAFKFKKS